MAELEKEMNVRRILWKMNHLPEKLDEEVLRSFTYIHVAKQRSEKILSYK